MSQNETASADASAHPVVVAYGAGVNSTAMLIGLKRRAERVDLVLFADTGCEKPETYAYLPVINRWLASVGYPSVTVIKRASPRAGDASLFDECHRKSVLPSLAYGGHSCSLKWKVDPQWSYRKRLYGWSPRLQSWAHGPWITKLIGYDAGPADARRVRNAVGKWPPGHVYRYPLLEWGWDRERCIEDDPCRGSPGSDQERVLHVPGLEEGRGGMAHEGPSRYRA